MKNIRKIAMWSLLACYLLIVSGFIGVKHDQLICNEIRIHVVDSLSQRFIGDEEVLHRLRMDEVIVLGQPLRKVNTHEVEQSVLKNNLIKSCKAYTTIDGKLNIELWQREPIVRIMDKDGRNYYIDREGAVISLSARFSPHLLVVNGNVRTPFTTDKLVNIFDEERIDQTKKLQEIHQLADFIASDKFWNAQIVQVYIDQNGEFELVPRIGPHLIKMGPIDDYEEKFWKLKTLYTEGLHQKGWNQYLIINLKYKDQIVCTKN